jgi:hypothetical protein
MASRLLPLVLTAAIGSAAISQTIVKVPRSEAQSVARPDDLFNLPPGQWHFAKSLWEGSAPCTPTQCEAGFTADALVISVEHAGEFVRIIAGLRDCEAVAFSEVGVGKKPGKPTYGRVRKQAERVVKGLARTCKLAVPDVPAIDAARLFPRSGASTS